MFGLWAFELFIVTRHTPLLVVLAVAGIVCLRRLKDCPREAWLIGAAVAILAFDLFGVPKLHSLALWTGIVSIPFDGHARSWIMFHLVYGLPSSLATSAAWGLILYAAFGEGSGPRSKYLVEDERTKIEID